MLIATIEKRRILVGSSHVPTETDHHNEWRSKAILVLHVLHRCIVTQYAVYIQYCVQYEVYVRFLAWGVG